jgi:hypothetical protein
VERHALHLSRRADHLTNGVPATGSVFKGWNGDPDCLDGVVTMGTFANCVARFDNPQAALARYRGDFNADSRK